MSAVRRLRTITEQTTSWEALRATLEALPVPAAVLDVERTALAWNHAAESAFGWPAAEVIGTRLPLVTDAGAPQLRALLQGALHAPTPIRLEVEGRTRSGEALLLRMAGAALPQQGTGVARVAVTFEDVTELGQLRRKLHRARKYSRGLADLSPDGMLIVREGAVAYANAAAARLMGMPRRQIVGCTLEELVQADPADIQRLAATPAARDAGASIETRLRSTRSEPVDVEIVARPMRFRRRPSLLVVIRDATLRRRVELELARTQDRFRVLSESVRGHAVIATDAAGCIVAWNDGAERLFGHAAAAIVGQHVGVLFREADAAAGRPDLELRTTLEVGRFEGEEWRRRADGTEFWAAVTLVPQYGAGDRLIGFAASVHDLTERREAQEALRRTEEQLRHAQRMEAVGRLTAGVAHDFNNLLTAIRGYAQLLLEDLGSDPRTADVEEIRRAADRGTTLTRQLLAIGRRQAQQPGVLDLNSVVVEAEKMLQRIVGEDVRLITELERNLGRVNADAAQLEQVLMNLVVNARDAMPQGGRITISTRNQAP
ncbi:MAG TPA: PAS domain S-box protein, partial [Longimicrobiales bacterium]